jgi:hypothetical protein
MAEPTRFFGVFAKLRKANLSFFMSAHPSACLPAWYNFVPTARIFMRFHLFFKKSVHKNIQVH